MRTIKFRAKNKYGQWVYGTNNPAELNRSTHCVSLAYFWQQIEDGRLLKDTVGQYVEFTNNDNSKGCGYEGDIIKYGGDRHNGVIVFDEKHGDPSFHTTKPKIDGFKRNHGLPPTTATVKIIGNVYDNPKLQYRWGRS